MPPLTSRARGTRCQTPQDDASSKLQAAGAGPSAIEARKRLEHLRLQSQQASDGGGQVRVLGCGTQEDEGMGSYGVHWSKEELRTQ